MKPTSEQDERSQGESPRAEQRILSMTPDAKALSSIEGVLRRHIEEIGEAIRDKDLDRLMACYASDVVAFDVARRSTRTARTNIAELRALVRVVRGAIGLRAKGLRIAPGEGAAFCHYLSLITGARPEGRKSGYWVRGTTCSERRDGHWLVTHEHIAMPTSM